MHLKEKGGLNVNKGKYRVYILSPHKKKSVGTIRRENREFLYPFSRNQERNTKILRTHLRLRA
jgi:hypothetical protein